MLSRRALTGLIAAGAAAGARASYGQTHAPAPAPSPRRPRRDEAAALRAFAEKTHPRGREAAADAAWRSGWSELDTRADTLSPAGFIMALMARLAWFQDGHTTIFVSAITAPGFDLRLPIQAGPFYDGLYVTAAKDEGTTLLGARIVRVDGEAIEAVIRRFARDWPGANPAWAHHDAPLALIPALMRGAGLTAEARVGASAGAPVLIEAERDGRALRARLIPSAAAKEGRMFLPRAPTPLETWRPGQTPNFVRRQGSALVIAFDSLSEDLDPMLAYLGEAIAATDDASLDRVVLDLRRNGGGNNFFGEGLRKALERSRFNRPGGLYVVIGPQTFSAAQNLANRLERETYALFVGEPTGGEPNHYGDSAIHKGDGYVAAVSTIPWFDSYPMDKRRWIMPDILVPALFADWRGGKDPALDAALAHRTDAKPDDLSRERTFFYERASQKVEWKPFWMA